MLTSRKFWPAAASALVTGCALAGCGRQVHTASENSAPFEPQRAISVRIADVESYQSLLDEQMGKVVLVDFWATWCGPCVEQFPHTVELYREYHERGLAVICVSLDDPSAEPQVLSFLERNDARFINLLSSYGGGSEAIEAFGLPGPVPCYRVYDRSGRLRHEFAVDAGAQRQFTPADIEAAVVELL